MLAPNSLLQNRYLIIRAIGQGGMGAVYLAKDQRLGNTVALKETFFTDARMRKAFEREARLLAHLRHPALPKVIDHFGEGEGQFLVMEFIPGDDLEVLLAQRAQPFPPDQVLRWADQLLDALDYLHTQDSPILHRDIKPANLKLTSRDQIILLDFGLAKGAAGYTTSVAASRSVLGFTPNFAPLEQIHGKGTNVRSDLYALGATLYYLMTGVIPPDAVSRATASISGQADPLLPADELSPQVPSTTSVILNQAMALNPDQRPAGAAEMRKALQEQKPLSGSAERAESSTLILPVPDSTASHAQADRHDIPSPIPPTVPSAYAVQNPPQQPTMPAVDFSPPTSPQVEASPTLPSQVVIRRRRLPWVIGGVAALLIVGIVIALFATRHSFNSDSGDMTGVAATVNGKRIMLSAVDSVIAQQSESKQLTPLQLRQARLQVLDGLIQREALFQRAEKEKLLPAEDQVTAFINEQRRQSGMNDDEFSRKLKEQNLTMDSLREEATRVLAIKALEDKHAGKISISDREVEDYYNANKEVFVYARGVALAMIAVDPADNSAKGITNDAKGDSDAKAKIDRISHALKEGADFGTMVRLESEDANSLDRGGDIGFATEDELKQNSFPRDLIDQFFGPMSVGSFTAPVRFNSGLWYIFKLTDKRLQTEKLTLDSPGVRQQIVEALVNERRKVSNTELQTTAINEARIVNYLAASKTPN